MADTADTCCCGLNRTMTTGGSAFMNIRILIILFYLAITLTIGIIFRKKSSHDRIEFFLAGRNLSGPLLFFTMAASNFSAFTIFGLSGAGYRMGYAFYPVMGFGTGFMALSMFLVGSKLIPLAREHGFITPSDYIQHRFSSPFLSKLVSLIMVIFTLPYLALQAIAAGGSLQSLTGLPYAAGAAIITGFVIMYVTLGGLHSIVWTDFLQGVMMVVLTVIAFSLIASKTGGFVPTHLGLSKTFPGLFDRPGFDGSMGPGIWFGYIFLWFFSVPFTPHLFQRFIAARDKRSLRTTVVLYPLITTGLFFFTVSIGVMGRATFPGVETGASDTIFPLLLGRYTSVIGSTVLLTGSIAALMSTMDAQLLTLTSIISIDFIGSVRRRSDDATTVAAAGAVVPTGTSPMAAASSTGEPVIPAEEAPSVTAPVIEKIIVVLLGISGFLIALNPPATLLDFIRSTTFNGISVLSVPILGGLYWSRANKMGAIVSIVVGETLVILFNLGILPTFGFLSVIPIVLVTGGVFILTCSLSSAGRPGGTGLTGRGVMVEQKRRTVIIASGAALFLVLGNDFWNWGRAPVLFAGLPLWVWWFVGLGILLSVFFQYVTKAD